MTTLRRAETSGTDRQTKSLQNHFYIRVSVVEVKRVRNRSDLEIFHPRCKKLARWYYQKKYKICNKFTV